VSAASAGSEIRPDVAMAAQTALIAKRRCMWYLPGGVDVT
jgi:hypothetical protein